MLLKTLIDNIDYLELVNIQDDTVDISGISYNSKKTKPYDAFICLSGEHVDGHEYAEEAVSNGASICVVERRLYIDIPQIVVADTSISIAQIADVLYSSPSKKINLIGDC